MNFEEWEPIYTEILSYFSFSRPEDERSANILASLTQGDALSDARMRIQNAEQIVVCGNAPCLR